MCLIERRFVALLKAERTTFNKDHNQIFNVSDDNARRRTALCATSAMDYGHTVGYVSQFVSCCATHTGLSIVACFLSHSMHCFSRVRLTSVEQLQRSCIRTGLGSLQIHASSKSPVHTTRYLIFHRRYELQHALKHAMVYGTATSPSRDRADQNMDA